MLYFVELFLMIVYFLGLFSGMVQVLGDKLISYCVLIFGVLLVGEMYIIGFLEGQDVLDIVKVMQVFGVQVECLGIGEWKVNGVGVGGFVEFEGVIDCGNFGIGVCLIMGVMVIMLIIVIFIGDVSLLC